ncbi:MAG: phosphoglycerate kinase [Acidimicrobiales bacterium]
MSAAARALPTQRPGEPPGPSRQGPSRQGPSRPGPLRGLPLLEDLPPVDGKRVLVRVDFNVPLEEGGDGEPEVDDDFRIRRALPALRWLLEGGARVTACSHLGRPPGAPDPRWTMAPVRQRLNELCPGVTLMENLRFSPGEEANDPSFVTALVDGQDAYVNEAFGVTHRAHASVVGPPGRLPSAAGRCLAREVAILGGLLEEPARPFVAVVGGAKVADKLGVLRALAAKVDVLAIGGAMAFTFLLAGGHRVGASLVDERRLEDCRKLLASGVRVLLPADVVALEPGGAAGAAPCGRTEVMGTDLPDGWRGLDIGPATAEKFAQAIAGAGTVLWNGPLGVAEDERFAGGTRRVAEAVARCPGFTVVGGGDSANALDHLGLADRVDFLSTGGGASLQYVEDGDLPGLAALRAASNSPAASIPSP